MTSILSDTSNSQISKKNNKKLIYEQYLKNYDLEKIISEMANSVIHSQSETPIIYMIKYLTGLLTSEEREKNNINIPPPYPKGVPIVHFPKFEPNNLLSKYLNKNKWYEIKHIKTKYNNNINNLTSLSNTGDKIGLCLCDDDCIVCFKDLCNNIICDVHNLDKNIDKEFYKIGKYQILKEKIFFFMDKIKDKFKNIRFEFNRNVEWYTFNNINKQNYKLKEDFETEIESLVGENILDVKKIDNLEEFINSDVFIKNEINWMKKAHIENKYYTLKDRAIYSNDDKTVIILINFANHLKLIINTNKINNSNDIIEAYNKGVNILRQLSLSFSFSSNKKYGYLTSNISFLGSGFRIHSEIELKNINNYKKYIENLNLSYFIIKDKILFSSYDSKIYNKDEFTTMSKYLSRICGLIDLDITDKNINLEKKELKNNNEIKQIYDKTFDLLKYNVSPNGDNINSVMNYYITDEKKDNLIFIDKFDYYTYSPFIYELINKIQNFDLNISDHISKPDAPKQISQLDSFDIISHIQDIEIILYRNFKNFPFPCNSYYSKESNPKIVQILKEALNHVNSKEQLVEYIPYENAKDFIEKNNLKFSHNENMINNNIDNDFPNNRGVLKIYKDYIYGLVNDLDHLKFIYKFINSSNEKHKISRDMVNLLKIVNEINKYIPFEYDNKFGFFTSNPLFLGTGMSIKVKLIINNSDEEKIQNLQDNNKIFTLTILEKKENKSMILLIENKVSIGLSETELLCSLLFYLKNIIELDINK